MGILLPPPPGSKAKPQNATTAFTPAPKQQQQQAQAVQAPQSADSLLLDF